MYAKETSLFASILIASGIILVVFGYFLFTILRYHRRGLRLYKAKILAEITTLENERRRMAADLHDDLGPIVAGIKLKLGSLDTANEEDRDTKERIDRNLNDLIARMKEISNDLVPPLLLKKGLVEALQLTVSEMNSVGKLQVDFEYRGIPPLTEDVSVNLYRMLQEIIHNTLRHSEASKLLIRLLLRKNILVLWTEDNGKGFDYAHASLEHSGLGLRNLLSRTEVLKGHMFVDTALGKGTRYTFEIPFYK